MGSKQVGQTAPMAGRRFGRRAVLGGAAAVAAMSALPSRSLLSAPVAAAQGATPAAWTPLPAVTIDLASEPATLDPATTYDPDGWSVVHSIYDSVVQYAENGELQPVLAEALTWSSPTVLEIKLRPGIVFHNGEPLTAESVVFSFAHLQDPATKSQVAGNFAVIAKVEAVDDLTARLTLSAPAPWLPAQLAAWLCLLPPKYAGDPANDFAAKPVGTGPFKFVGWQRGASVELARNPDYALGAVKGNPIADKVTYRFVAEPNTRIADVLSGAANLTRGVPVDQFDQVEAQAKLILQPVSGTVFLRIPNDIAPFTDPRVAQALNYAIDVDAIVAALLGGSGARLANFFVPGGLGFNPDLAPFSYDVDKAKSLLAEAGLGGGFETVISTVPNERADIAEAISGQLADIGVKAKVQIVETAAFNAGWKEQTNELRYVSWRPMFDPFTLLNLLVSKDGFLSRYNNPKAQALIESAAVESDAAKRAQQYQALGQVLFDEPAALYLYQLTTFYGADRNLTMWEPRSDDYLLPLGAGA